MSHNRRPKRKLTPLQALLVVLLIVGGAVFEYLRQEMDLPEPIESFPLPTVIVAGEAQVEPAETEAEAVPAADEPIPPAEIDVDTGEPAADFDFYVLALSWSPDYCAANGKNDPQQCSTGRKLGFVLHGLWPQYNQGYPSSCSTEKLPPAVKVMFPALYPSPKLYDHEWEKHGTCSGLDPENYLRLSQQLKDAVIVPAVYRTPAQPLRTTAGRLKTDFVGANPSLDEAGLAVYCSGSGRFLKELYVCFSTAGRPAACSREIQSKAAKSCGQADFLVRNVK